MRVRHGHGKADSGHFGILTVDQIRHEELSVSLKRI